MLTAYKIETRPQLVEFVERKGKGHPDTVCDALSERLSVELSRHYLNETNMILHHNVDKAVLVGGQAKPEFGGGSVTEPIYILLVGRATGKYFNNGNEHIVPIGSIAIKAAKDELRRIFRFLDPDQHVIIDYRIKQGSVDLVGNFNASNAVPLSNDTSFGVGFYPLSDTERLVLNVETYLNSKKGKDEFPELGEDIKVMAFRNGNNVTLTVAAAMISKLIGSPSEYMEVKKRVTERIKEIASEEKRLNVNVIVNNADNVEKGIYYITVTGTSAENGDDGQVGRGNRANGLITPFRPMTLEATAGKNPRSHTGKIYSVLAREIAQKLVEENKRISSAQVYMLSQIGRPITDPLAVYVEATGEISQDALHSHAESVINEVLQRRAKELWKDILEGKVELF